MKTPNDARHIRWNNKKLPVLCGSRRIICQLPSVQHATDTYAIPNWCSSNTTQKPCK